MPRGWNNPLIAQVARAVDTNHATLIATVAAAIAAIAAVAGIVLTIYQLKLSQRHITSQRARDRYDMWVARRANAALEGFTASVTTALTPLPDQGDLLEGVSPRERPVMDSLLGAAQTLGLTLTSGAEAVGNADLRDELRQAAQDLEDEISRKVEAAAKNLDGIKLDQVVADHFGRIGGIVESHSP